METAVFDVGDTVRHRASGERGVVVSVNGNRRCKKHALMSSIHFVGTSDECEWVVEFDGTYDVSITLEKTVESVIEGLLVLDEETSQEVVDAMAALGRASFDTSDTG